MPSPFPGMDPWLESRAIFPSFHNTFIAELSAALNASLPPPYFTTIETRMVIEGDSPDRVVEPDLYVLCPSGANGGHAAAGGGGVATVEEVDVKPVTVHVPLDEQVEWLLEVRTGEGDDQLVTTIELLSRSNKRTGSEDRAQYVRKQREMRERQVSMVEIDLLRAGTHTTLVPLPAAVRRTGPFDYHVCTHRPSRRGDFDVYPIHLAQRLPAVAIPLAAGAADVPVNLQMVADRCYDVGLYSRRVKYTDLCDPPLTSDQQVWADGVLRAKGLRPERTEG